MKTVRLASVFGIVLGSAMIAACGAATPAPETGGAAATPAIAAVPTGASAYGAPAASTPAGSSDSTAATTPASEAAAANTVNVTVKDFQVVPAVSSVKAGTVQFVVTNQGPKEEHELVVIKTDAAPEALPTKTDGSADEDNVPGKKMGEVEEVPVGESKRFVLDLEPGNYVLICNVVVTKDGTAESHYEMGMHAPLTVTP